MPQPSKLYRFRIGTLYLLAIIALMQISALGYPNEACGIVTKIVDGDTFDVTIERGDQRLSSGVERVRLADVDSPEIDTDKGIDARDLTSAILLNRRVYLDIDDYSPRDSYGRLVCVVYLSGYYDQPIAVPCFNRILVDSGMADVEDFSDNEFDPDDWWRGSRSYGSESASSLQAAPSAAAEASNIDTSYGDAASSDLASRGSVLSELATTESSYAQSSSSEAKSGKPDLETVVGDLLRMLYNEVLKELNKRATQTAQ
jgi:endonuclease YncB( thermonuclease family)